MEKLVNLSDVLDIVDHMAAPPDGWYYANKTKEIEGWVTAASRIKGKLEQLGERKDGDEE